MEKRLIVCADGTWNSPDQKDRGQRHPTNIVKIARGITPVDSNGVSQVTYYDVGVGSHWAKSVELIEGATGYGVARNMIEAYRFLCLNYVPGDPLYLFGFSRGAYTVRSLAGFIDRVGLLPKENAFFTPEAFDLYRRQDRGRVRSRELNAFREKHGTLAPTVRFLGVFDTVRGIPKTLRSRFFRKQHEFHDLSLPSIVERVYHALAIDEQRWHFQPSLFEPADPVDTARLEQVWYAGVHSNIGGGFNPDGLANFALHSMRKRAEQQGLEFDRSFLQHYKTSLNAELRHSRKGWYKLTPRAPRTLLATTHGNERVHPSAYMRRNHAEAGYTPRNLPIEKG